MQVFGLWKESEGPQENSQKHRENMAGFKPSTFFLWGNNDTTVQYLKMF